MINIESVNGTKSDEKTAKNKLYTFYIVLSAMILNLFLAGLRWFNHIGLTDFSSDFMSATWKVNAVIILVLILLFKFMGAADNVYSPNKMRSDTVEITSKHPSGYSVPGIWRLFEYSVLGLVVIGAVLMTAKYNGLFPLIDLGRISVYINTDYYLSYLTDRISETGQFLFTLYLPVKVAILTDSMETTFNRLYLNKIRIHESVFGLYFIAIGTCLILFQGYVPDRILGIVYVIIGSFFMGRDYRDVKDFKFIQREKR